MTVRIGKGRLFVAFFVVVVLAFALAWSGYSKTRLPATTPPRAGSGAAGPVADETYRWRPVAIGGGGFIVGLSADRSGKTRVVRTDVYGAYLWQPDSNKWVQLVTAPAMPSSFRRPAGMWGGVYGIAVAPSDSSRIYMAAKGTVFHSDDRGKSWRIPASGPFPLNLGVGSKFMRHDPVIAVNPRDPDMVFFGTAFDGLVRSVDGGRNWRKVALPQSGHVEKAAGGKAAPPILIWFAPSAKGQERIWTLVPGIGMFASDDAGETFQKLPSLGLSGPATLSAGAFAPDGTFFGADQQGKTIWRYREGEWSDLAKAGNLPSANYLAVAVDPRNSDIFIFENNGHARRSSDGGESWSRLSARVRVGEKDPPWLRIADHPFFATAQVMFDPVVAHRLWIAAGMGVYRADIEPGSGRIKWVSQTRGIEELVANDVVQSSGHAPLFAAWDFGIHIKPDLDAYSTGFGPKERVLIAAQQLALTPADPDFVVTNASDTRRCCSHDGQSVLAGYSEDAGRTWHRFATLPHPPGTKANDPWRMAWGMIAVSSGNPDNIIWAPSLNRSPFFTSDRGHTWNRVKFPGERLPYTGSHRAWHLQRKVLVADPERSDTFYLVHSGNPHNPQLEGLWRTQDGGASWTMLYSGEIAPKSGMAAKLRAMPGREGHLFFTSAVEKSQDSRLRRSNDGGRNWDIVPGVTQVDDIAFGKAAAGTVLPTIYISGFVQGEYGIWRSIDDARTWTKIAAFPAGRLDRVVVMGADPDVFGRVYIGWQGSGWSYGEPARCHAASVQPFESEECYLAELPASHRQE